MQSLEVLFGKTSGKQTELMNVSDIVGFAGPKLSELSITCIAWYLVQIGLVIVALQRIHACLAILLLLPYQPQNLTT